MYFSLEGKVPKKDIPGQGFRIASCYAQTASGSLNALHLFNGITSLIGSLKQLLLLKPFMKTTDWH
jgi:hypothetical protein